LLFVYFVDAIVFLFVIFHRAICDEIDSDPEDCLYYHPEYELSGVECEQNREEIQDHDVKSEQRSPFEALFFLSLTLTEERMISQEYHEEIR
jgi:hypothetical protein